MSEEQPISWGKLNYNLSFNVDLGGGKEPIKRVWQERSSNGGFFEILVTTKYSKLILVGGEWDELRFKEKQSRGLDLLDPVQTMIVFRVLRLIIN